MLIKYDKADILKEKNDFGIGKVENVKMLVIQSYDCDSAALAYSDLSINTSKQPAHYVVDATDVIKYCPSSTNIYDSSVTFTAFATSLLPAKESTSIFDTITILSVPGLKEHIEKTMNNDTNVNKAIDDDFRGNYINVIEVCWGDKTQYQAVANNLVLLLAYLIRNHGYTLDNIWRAGDIIDFGPGEKVLVQRNPYQYTHLKDWHSLLDAVAYCVDNPDEDPPISTYCFDIDDHIDSPGHCPSPGLDPEHSHSGHVHHWENDDRNITEIEIAISIESSSMINEDFTSKTINGSNFMESNFQPDSTQDFVKMESNYYEPIYPDLKVPPRSATSLYNMGVATVKQILDGLTLAEQKAQQEAAELEAQKEGDDPPDQEDPVYANRKIKPVIGKIPNIFDPYPVDAKIAQLEHHAPMVTLEFEESQNIQDNLAFYVINRFINTEKRLVQLENIMATQTRLLNCLSSRIKINCVYYGGQSVFDKYKCIRCLSDDLTNDAACVTLDQCLNCSRYEPIEGQVYEIMDEDLKPGEANIFDDIQASYMTKEDYVELNRIEILNEEDEYASQDITKTNERDESDKDYETLLAEANNFVMNWQRKPWDYQSPHINIYEYDFAKIGLEKDLRLNPNNKYEDGWKLVKQQKFERPDYGINILGDGINNKGYVYNGSNTVPLYFTLDDYEIDPNDIRFKIIEYAEQAAEYCKKSQTFQYTFGAKIIDRQLTPDQLVEKAIKGEEVSTGKTDSDTLDAVYTDCSNFANYIYYVASSGKIDIPDTTATLYENNSFDIINKDKEVLEAIKDAIPGDLLLFKGIGSAHVSIYVGKDECCEAYGESTEAANQVAQNKLNNRKDFVGIYRHKMLSVPKLKMIQYIDVDDTIGNWVQTYQCNANKNTVDGTDQSYTRDANVISKYVDPNTRMTDQLCCQFAFIKNPFPDGYITEDGINRFFEKKGRKKDMAPAAAWIEAGKRSGLNPLFLIVHSIGETAWNASKWMNGGSESHKDSSGNTLYNAYGLWCYNNDSGRLAAIEQCSKRGWFDKSKAVIEGAEYVAEQYISAEAEAKHGMRNTIYFMKWHFGKTIEGNPGNPGTMQYASDITWADQRAKLMYEMMECMDGGIEEAKKYLRLLIPRFKTN